MNRLSRRTIGIITLAILVVLVIFALFIEFNHVVRGPARFVAYSEWTLINSEQDKLKSQHFYNGSRYKNDIFLFHFERPDFIRFSLNEKLQIGTLVNAGDVVAQLMSSEDDIRLATIIGQLDEVKASLLAFRTGEKKAIQVEAQEALNYAQAKLAAYEPILQRHKELHAQNLISDQALDTTLARYDLYNIEVSLQEAHLLSTKTGEKEETISIIAAQVDAIENQLDIFKQKLEAMTIKSPISGILVQPDLMLGELCHICEIDSIIVQMPLAASDVKYVQVGMPMSAHLPSTGKSSLELNVLDINYNASIINMQPMYMVTAVAPNIDGRIMPGMTGNVKIHVGKMTLFARLADAWARFRFNR
ncbi:hypothetical protein EH223_15115 [candidate division KSB1 bacterium]|nr:hypothetical protein [candidate division KSB1 bacterium]RQW01245.1 MAG: hypothetical protein EH223_15115 [candidate division KSB1 bacterium]